MKKIVVLFMVLVLAISFIACSKKNEEKAETDTTTQTTETTTKMVDENLIDVEFTLPASFFSEDEPATSKLSEKQKKQGIKKAVVNKDGSVTYTISKKAFRELKKTIKKEVTNGLNTLNKDFPCIKKVEFNDDFSDITLYVNADEYEGLMNAFSVYQAGIYGQMYQVYTGVENDKLSVDVKVVNVDTSETIEQAHYPKAE